MPPGTHEVSSVETVGVDLGGTKMLVGAVDGEGRVLHRRVVPSKGLTAEELLAELELRLREAVEARPAVCAVGLGIPCTIDRGRGMCVNAVNLPLREVPVRDLVHEHLALPVSIDNDANTAVLAEQRRGSAAGAANVVMLTIGTGIGGGLIIDGQPYRGSTGAGAELGHVVIDIDGPPCQGSCPNRGCIEAIASGTALAREGARAAAEHPDSALGLAAREEASLDGRLVTELALGGDPVAVEVLAIVGRRLGAALSGLANIFDPDVLVVGGGVMAAGDLLLDPAREEFAARALPPQDRIPIRAAALGSDAGMIGAALLAAEELALGPGAGAPL